MKNLDDFSSLLGLIEVKAQADTFLSRIIFSKDNEILY